MKKLLFLLIGISLTAGAMAQTDPKSHISKISKRKKAITYLFEAQIASHFFQYLKDIIS